MPNLEVRDVHWVKVHGEYADDPHPGVIYRVEEDRSLVICGGGTPTHDGTHLTIIFPSAVGRKMGLTKDTHFRHTGVVWIENERIGRRLGKVDLGTFLDFETLVYNVGMEPSD
jgi:hypothetical protein